jgi:hypothetical protein
MEEEETNKITDVIRNFSKINLFIESNTKIHYNLHNSDFTSLHYFFCR